MKKVLPLLVTILVFTLCYVTLKQNKQTIIVSVGTIEQNIESMRRSAASIEARGGNATEIRGHILYYEKEAQHFREILEYMKWL